MRKVKIFGIILIMLITSTGWAATYTTVRVNPSTAYAGTAGTKYLPAVVRGQSLAVAALQTAVMALPATRGGQIAAALAMAGLTYGADKLFDYLESEGFNKDPTTGDVTKTTTINLPDTISPNGNLTGYQEYDENGILLCEKYNGLYPSATAAQAAANALGWGTVVTSTPTHDFGYTWTPGYLNAYKVHGWVEYGKTYRAEYFFFVPNGIPTHPYNYEAPAAEGDIASSVTTGLTNDNKAANDALNDTLNRVNDSLTNLNDTLRNSPKWSDIQGYLDQGIDQATKDALDTKLSDPNASATYASETTTTTTNNSTTYNTTTNNYYENQGTFAPLSSYNQGTQTNKSAFEQPEVGDFSQLMSDFIDTMQNTDLFSLPGLMTSSIPSGGDCQLTINLGSHFGGSKTISFCEWATALSYIKAVLLCLASVVAVGIVCKGGAA